MYKEYIKDLLVLVITMLIMILVISTSLFPGIISVGSYYISHSSILAAILFLVLMILKSNEKIALVQDVQRIDTQRLITLLVYKFTYLALIFTFIHTNQISFFIGLLIIFIEFVMSSLNMIIAVKKIQYTGSKFILSIRDYIFNILILVLILNNMPFELYSIPIDLIAISLYVTILLYITYSLIEIVRSEL